MLRRGGGTTRRQSRHETGRANPWAVLAVVLALMALVASLSATRHGVTSPVRSAPARSAPARSAPARSAPARRSGSRSPATAEAQSPAGSLAASTDIAQVSMPSGGQEPGAHPTSSPSTTVTVSPSTPGAPQTTPGTVPAVPAVATADRTDPGNLVYPDNISASYTAPAAGGVTATATWSGSPTLSLTVTCPSGHASRSGPSGLSVSEPVPAGAPGTCTVSLAETPSVPSTVSYLLAIGTSGA
ncbi:MAG: hypothetical protein ACYDHU_12765 [Acidimicrobiales bacterium]